MPSIPTPLSLIGRRGELVVPVPLAPRVAGLPRVWPARMRRRRLAISAPPGDPAGAPVVADVRASIVVFMGNNLRVRCWRNLPFPRDRLADGGPPLARPSGFSLGLPRGLYPAELGGASGGTGGALTRKPSTGNDEGVRRPDVGRELLADMGGVTPRPLPLIMALPLRTGGAGPCGGGGGIGPPTPRLELLLDDLAIASFDTILLKGALSGGGGGAVGVCFTPVFIGFALVRTPLVAGNTDAKSPVGGGGGNTSEPPVLDTDEDARPGMCLRGANVGFSDGGGGGGTMARPASPFTLAPIAAILAAPLLLGGRAFPSGASEGGGGGAFLSFSIFCFKAATASN
mmetsp:Transcript_35845/g.93426  ORF Transcript_35845/g.93426 Transcript_35845/m.93426 type:complete len:343 (-) Transcript_35845:2099-3127(-)